MDTPAIYYPKPQPQTLEHFTGPQKMPYFVKTQEQEQITEDCPPPIYIESVGEQGGISIRPRTDINTPMILTTLIICGLVLFVSLLNLIKQ
ncbi:hypothetical protein N9Z44_01105 [Mariniblastus sp.]|nr:hypothetical protein [Mariniblastus sp.]